LPAPVTEQPRDRIRIIKSNQWVDFTPESCIAMLTETFRISPDSERMGYRLAGPTLSLSTPRQMISEATTFGTIQVPAGGQPIVLMADTQTTGGYPKIAYVASVDLPLLAQMVPGDHVRFESIKLENAQALDMARTTAFERLAQALQPIEQLITAHVI
jgi:allophanate hydrolase subunit 2